MCDRIAIGRTDALTSMGNSMREESQASASVHEVGDHMQAYEIATAQRLSRCTKEQTCKKYWFQ